jgi:predicted DNA-binding transcriptional regulator AlpA
MFPRPINLGPRTIGWLDRDIEAWINDKAQASRAGIEMTTASGEVRHD